MSVGARPLIVRNLPVDRDELDAARRLRMVGGIAAQIVAARHHAISGNSGFGSGYLLPVRAASGWSTTTYDVVRIGGWALLIFGAVIVVFALVREIRR